MLQPTNSIQPQTLGQLLCCSGPLVVGGGGAPGGGGGGGEKVMDMGYGYGSKLQCFSSTGVLCQQRGWVAVTYMNRQMV